MKGNSSTRFVVVAGGVISGVGKGVATASIGKILKEHGYKTTLIKIDPYINCDAGTLRPTEHGEVWVTEDGGEIDQDLGTYERFMGADIPKQNNITTGQIYKVVIDRERGGEYLGKTVQFIPHIIEEVIRRVKVAAEGYEIAVVEIGGTVGDYENVPFLFAFKALEREVGSDHIAYMLVTYLPVPSHIDEMKTKPTQQAIRLLGEQGIMPDFIICRSQFPLDEIRRKKIEVFAHINSDQIIAAPDITSVIYQMPIEFEKQEVGKKLLRHFNLPSKHTPDWNDWLERIDHITNPKTAVRVAIVGKYLDIGAFSLADSYISIYHALIHAGAESCCAVDITWLDSKKIESDGAENKLADFDGVIIPGGFGASGVEGKINAISFVRKNNIPYLGLCYGLHLAAVEYARNVCNLTAAHTTEVDRDTPHPIIDVLSVQKKILQEHRYGGSMRLGAYKAVLSKGSMVHQLYCEQRGGEVNEVWERHRHRYEINTAYVDMLEQAGFMFSGHHICADGTKLMEFAEIPGHRFFIGTQPHPEFKSQFGNPNPLFCGFVKACMVYAQERLLTLNKTAVMGKVSNESSRF